MTDTSSADTTSSGHAAEQRARELLDRYLAGEASDAEIDANALAEHLGDSPDAAREFLACVEMMRELDRAVEGDGKLPRLGDYRLVREIGRGGMGVVYEAEQISLERRVAIKILPAAAVLDERQVLRFRNEARVAATLNHPNIVPVFAVGCEDHVHYYAMQLVDGVSLRQVLGSVHDEGQQPGPHTSIARQLFAVEPAGATERKEGGASSASSSPAWCRRVAQIVRDVARALDHAHELGVLHRDVKPANLLVDTSGRVWVTDFGVAHLLQQDAGLTLSGEVVGTLVYSSPEQVSGQRAGIDRRSDVYSLGATLYELLTERPPFKAEDRGALVQQVLQVEPRPPRSLNPQIPPDLATIVGKAMTKEPAYRYETAADLAADLDAFLVGEPIRARPIGCVGRVARWTRRNPGLATALAASLISVLAALAIGRFALQAAHDRDQAETAESTLRIVSARAAAEAARRSRVAGQRAIALDHLAEAAADLRASSLPATEARMFRRSLRDEALAVFATWDAIEEPIGTPTHLSSQVHSRDLAVRALWQKDGRVLIESTDDGALIGSIETGSNLFNVTLAGPWLATTHGNRLSIWQWSTGGRVLESVPLSAWQSYDVTGNRAYVATASGTFLVGDLFEQTWTELGIAWPVDEKLPTGRPSVLRAYGGRLALLHRGDDRIWVLDLAGTEAPRVLRMPQTPWSVAWHPDGKQLLAGAAPAVQIFDVSTGTVDHVLRGHHAVVVAVAWHPNGQLVATDSWDGTWRLWDPAGEPILTVPSTNRMDFGFDSTGQQVVSGIAEDGSSIARRFAPPIGMRTLHDPHPHAECPKIAFHPSGRVMVTTALDAISVWDTARSELLGSIPLQEPLSVAFDNSGRLLVGGGFGGMSWAVTLDEREGVVHVGQPTTLAPREYGPDELGCDRTGDRVVHFDPNGPTSLQQRDGERSILPEPPARGFYRYYLDVAADGRHAAVGHWGKGSSLIWDLDTREVKEIATDAHACNVRFAPDGRRLLLFESHRWRILDVDTLATVVERERPLETPGHAGFSPDGRLLALTHTRKRILLVDTETWEVHAAFEPPEDVELYWLRFSPDGHTLAAGSYLNKIYTWDLTAMRAGLRGFDLDWGDEPLPEPTPIDPAPALRLEVAR